MKLDDNRGYTLIELLVVIAILGILVALAAPNLKTTYNMYKLKGAVSQLATDLRYTQQLALTTGKDFRVYFYGNYYIIKRIDERDPVTKNPTIETEEVKRDDFADIRFTNLSFAEFFADGSYGTKDTGILVSLDSSPGNSKTVTVTRLTGKVTVSP